MFLSPVVLHQGDISRDYLAAVAATVVIAALAIVGHIEVAWELDDVDVGNDDDVWWWPFIVTNI